MNTSSHGDTKKSSRNTCLSVILIDSVFKTGENYYPQVF